MKDFEFSWEAILAVTALLTSVASALIAFFTFKLQRSHNIRSVKPIIHIGQWDYENNLFVTLQNVGPGLAIVTKLSVSNLDFETKNNLYDWLPKKLPHGVNYKAYWTPYTSFVVQPNQSILLVEIPIDTTIVKQVVLREQLRKILGDLTVHVNYQDIYDNPMVQTNLRLSHFTRLDNVNTDN